MTHQEARRLLESVWLRVVGRDYSTQELLAVQAVALHETRYGQGWTGAMAGSNNWGAVQCTSLPDKEGKCPPGCAPHGDSHANGQKYGACFKVYPNAESGAADLVKWFAKRIGVLDAACSCVMTEFAAAMHANHYFEGSGKTPDECIASYAKPLQRCAETIAKALGEECLFCLTGPKEWPDLTEAEPSAMVDDDQGEPR